MNDEWEVERFTHKGRQFVVSHCYDDTCDTPWEREDGHGPVRHVQHREEKRPGERVLYAKERGYLLLYDFAAAVKLARKDGWDTPPYKQGKPGERAARAAKADYERLRRFCNNDWAYVGVIVRAPGLQDASLWGIESDSPDYHKEVARELADEMLAEAREQRRKAEVKHCLVGSAPA
jgi:hypothetical protein